MYKISSIFPNFVLPIIFPSNPKHPGNAGRATFVRYNAQIQENSNLQDSIPCITIDEASANQLIEQLGNADYSVALASWKTLDQFIALFIRTDPEAVKRIVQAATRQNAATINRFKSLADDAREKESRNLSCRDPASRVGLLQEIKKLSPSEFLDQLKSTDADQVETAQAVLALIGDRSLILKLLPLMEIRENPHTGASAAKLIGRYADLDVIYTLGGPYLEDPSKSPMAKKNALTALSESLDSYDERQTYRDDKYGGYHSEQRWQHFIDQFARKAPDFLYGEDPEMKELTGNVLSYLIMVSPKSFHTEYLVRNLTSGHAKLNETLHDEIDDRLDAFPYLASRIQTQGSGGFYGSMGRLNYEPEQVVDAALAISEIATSIFRFTYHEQRIEEYSRHLTEVVDSLSNYIGHSCKVTEGSRRVAGDAAQNALDALTQWAPHLSVDQVIAISQSGHYDSDIYPRRNWAARVLGKQGQEIAKSLDRNQGSREERKAAREKLEKIKNALGELSKVSNQNDEKVRATARSALQDFKI